MNTQRICPSCQKPIPPESVRDLCPECLMKAGFESGAAGAGGGSRFTPPAVEELAKLFPQLEILELLGQGGMGAVYKARQPGLDRFIAIKILPPEMTADPGFAERFAREARALARLNHPNIVGVYDFGIAGGLHHFLMEYVEGVNLRQLARAGRLSPREALKIVPQICDALQFAHDEGIVHRDIKPENIMVDNKGRVKITDFGLAKLLGREVEDLQLTGAQDVMGTPNYMAPEQIEQPRSVDHRADIYSLGVVFYELLTGELPIGKFAPPSSKVGVDVRLDEVVLHTLEKEPQRRYQHASQVKTDVVTIAQSQGVSPPSSQALSAADANLEAVRMQVRGPATGLLITAILNWAGISVIAFVLTFLSATEVGMKPITQPVVWIPLAALVLSGVMLVASLKMRRLESYRLAVLGSLLAMVITPGNIIGLPLGIWSLVVLSQGQVRAMFGKEHPLPRVDRPAAASGGGAWKIAIVIVAVVILLGALVVGGLLFAAIALPAFQRAAARAKASGAAAQTVSLASLDHAGGDRFLDLDRWGAVTPPRQYSNWPRQQKHEWLRAYGIDLMTMGNEVAQWKLLTPVDNGIKLTRVSSDAWDKDRPDADFWSTLGPPEPSEDLQFVTQGVELTQVLLEGRPTDPDHSFAFETANGGRGLIRVTGLLFGGGEVIGLKLRVKRFD